MTDVSDPPKKKTRLGGCRSLFYTTKLVRRYRREERNDWNGRDSVLGVVGLGVQLLASVGERTDGDELLLEDQR